MENFEGFKVLALQIYCQTGRCLLIAEAHNKAVVQKHTYAWMKCLGVILQINPGLSDE